MTTIFSDDFETKLGTIRTWIETDDTASFLSQDNYRIVTKGHEVVMQAFLLDKVGLSESIDIETSKGWRWFIKKTNTQTEKLAIFCKLLNPGSDAEYNASSGENLDAIEIENKIFHLHIGTEDGEIMQGRARKSDWMPKRFENKISFYESFTKYVDFGFETTIPELVEGEGIYFHFLVATNPIRQSKEYPDEQDISTWFAVDLPKRFLDNKLGNAGNDISNKMLP